MALRNAPRMVLNLWAAWAAAYFLSPSVTWAAIAATGDVSPPYMGADPWHVAGELVVGQAAHASLTVNGGSNVNSTAGAIARDPGVIATVVVSGGGTSWVNTGDLIVGEHGTGRLEVLSGASVVNDGASLGHLGGSGTALVEGAGSRWTTADVLLVGNAAQGALTIRDGGEAISGVARLGAQPASHGAVLVDGPASTWAIFETLSLGDPASGGAASLALTGTGSRVYVGTAAVRDGPQLLPSHETALVVSEHGGIARVNIHNGNTLHNAGSAYIGVGAPEYGTVTVAGAGSAWTNGGDVTIGLAGNAILSLRDGGSVSAGTLSVGPLGTVEGTGSITASLVNSGTIAPGAAPPAGSSAGSLAITGGYAQTAGGKLQINLFGTATGQFDALDVTGPVSLGGSLEVALGSVGGVQFVPQPGDAFTFLTAPEGISGTFASTDLPALAAGHSWQLHYSANAVTLAVAIPGDLNNDGAVDAADYVLWRKGLGTIYDQGHYNQWRQNFGAFVGTGTGPATAASLPEPCLGPVALFLMATFCASRRRRRG